MGVCADTFDYYAEVAPEMMKPNYKTSTGTAEFYARQRCFGNFEKISVLPFLWCHFEVVLPVAILCCYVALYYASYACICCYARDAVGLACLWVAVKPENAAFYPFYLGINAHAKAAKATFAQGFLCTAKLSFCSADCKLLKNWLL